jgi:hypothetical protein
MKRKKARPRLDLVRLLHALAVMHPAFTNALAICPMEPDPPLAPVPPVPMSETSVCRLGMDALRLFDPSPRDDSQN